MICKMSTAFLLLLSSALVLQTAEAVIFTLGGLAIDSALAFLVFTKFLHIPILLGKRSVDDVAVRPIGGQATSDEYLAVAAAMDADKCLPLAVCVAMAKSKDTNATKSKFDDLIVETFTNKINEPVKATKITPLSFYIEAAKFGQVVGSVDNCRLVSPTCKYSMNELTQLTSAVSQYQL